MQGWMGPSYAISAACATSNICILNAAKHIIRGETVSDRVSCYISCFITRLRFSEIRTKRKRAGCYAMWWL